MPSAAEMREMAAAARALADVPTNGQAGEFDLGWTNLRIRFSGGTYVARGAGIAVSCTAGPALAARAWAAKAEARAIELEAAS